MVLSNMIKYGRHNKPKFAIFIFHVISVFNSGIFTNSGRKVPLLQKKIQNYFDLKQVDLVSNGTVALELALRALLLNKSKNKCKYVVTTPFTHPSTVIAIENSGLKPIYIDIEEDYLCLDPKKVESFLRSTTIPLKDILCILPVHVMNNLCDLDKFKQISKRFKIPLIYDASHAVGATYKGKSALNAGIFSCASLHATKAFSTGEGGIVVSNLIRYHQKIHLLKNFGISPNGVIKLKGINGKLSEVSACYGLASLAKFTKNRNRKRIIFEKYTKEFRNLPLSIIKIRDDVEPNYNYFPILLKSNQDLKNVVRKFMQKEIGFRRYFFPSLDETKIYSGNACAISCDISSRILILPTNYNLKKMQIKLIAKTLKEILN